MQPYPPQPGQPAHQEQAPTPGAVLGLSVVLWSSAAISWAMPVFNVVIAFMAGTSPWHAFGSSTPHIIIGVLLAVAASPVTRGRSWAQTMARTTFIIQIVWQSLWLIGVNSGALLSLLLLPLAIVGLVLLHRPTSKWFFTIHNQPVNQLHRHQYAAYDPHQQMNQGHHPPQQYPQQAYEQYPQPPQHGSWGQSPGQQ